MSKRAIVCVDDENIILDCLGEQIENIFGNKYIYETAENADEGLEVLEELSNEGIDVVVIVSDWLMPGKKGDEFLIEVHNRFPDMVKIMLTGQADQSAIQNAMQNARLDAFLNKPWTAEQLENTINKGLLKFDKNESKK